MGNETRKQYSKAYGYTEEDQHIFWLGTGGFVGLILGIVLFCIQLGITDGASCRGRRTSSSPRRRPALPSGDPDDVGGVSTLVWVVG